MVVLILCLLIRLLFVYLSIYLFTLSLNRLIPTWQIKHNERDKKIIPQKQNNNNNIELVMRRDSQVNKMIPVLN
jgi:hypothetical protein